MKYKWDSHINSSITKANTTLEFFRRNIKISYTTFKEQAYKSLVRPSLEYACPVWDTYTNENIRYNVGLIGMLLTAIITPLALVI